ncbi:MAG: hypothetical protein IPP17_20830 [Bacteroidetes bacterium]|nr:hypothetical protein [Bacteroidota bacterium]
MAASRHKDTLGGKAFNPAFAATASARRKCGKWWGHFTTGSRPWLPTDGTFGAKTKSTTTYDSISELA